MAHPIADSLQNLAADMHQCGGQDDIYDDWVAEVIAIRDSVAGLEMNADSQTLVARVLEIVEEKTKEPRPRNAYWDARTKEDLEIIEELREEFEQLDDNN